MISACFEHVERAADVHVESGPREFVALEQPERREMDHALALANRARQHVGLEDVAAGFEDPHPRVAKSGAQVVDRAAAEIVVNDDLLHVPGEQLVHHVRADKARTADDADRFAAKVAHG